MLANSLLDVDFLVKKFIKDNDAGINTLHKFYYKTNDQLSLKSLLINIEEELKNGCVTFINKNYPEEEINNYLFYIVNAYCKRNAVSISKKKPEYLCPGCLFLGKDSVISSSQVFSCAECKKQLSLTNDPKKILLFTTFSKHNKTGYHCKDCNKFIPHPLDNSSKVSCPYFDCYFVGECSSLKKMHHPTHNSKLENNVITLKNKNLTKDIISNELNALSQLELKDDLKDKIKILKEVIESQSNNIYYSSSDFTVKHKQFTYQAFNNLIDQYPEEMVDYLLNNSRSGGFQHKIFQEYVKLLEAALPFVIKKNSKIYRVENLLDDNMCVFDGISTYEALVNDKMIAKNNTQEFYIGGRKASYTKPYYIGKLLSVTDKVTKKSLINNVKEYSFSKIIFKDVKPNTNIIVSHLRICPHYQMGGMVYVNRIRKKIVDKAQSILNKN